MDRASAYGIKAYQCSYRTETCTVLKASTLSNRIKAYQCSYRTETTARPAVNRNARRIKAYQCSYRTETTRIKHDGGRRSGLKHINVRIELKLGMAQTSSLALGWIKAYQCSYRTETPFREITSPTVGIKAYQCSYRTETTRTSFFNH